MVFNTIVFNDGNSFRKEYNSQLDLNVYDVLFILCLWATEKNDSLVFYFNIYFCLIDCGTWDL